MEAEAFAFMSIQLWCDREQQAHTGRLTIADNSAWWECSSCSTEVDITDEVRTAFQLANALQRNAQLRGDNDDDDDDDEGCLGHESTSGPIGNVVYCDGTCK